MIGDFVGAINKDWLWHSSDQGHSNGLMGEIISCFPSIPQTTSAIALWLVKLDTLIAPYVEKAQPERNQLLCRTRITSMRYFSKIIYYNSCLACFTSQSFKTNRIANCFVGLLAESLEL